ncbi:MAG TPA: radical SAM protein, partial [Mycobacteriales bacterium]|nr:radical SAM protein [Mycobacteriales bacterium]
MTISSLLARAAHGGRITPDEALLLYTDAPLHALGAAADAVRRRRYPDNIATYIIDRNINYTNVCVTACRFCAFFRNVGDTDEGYVLSREQLGRKIQETVDAGGHQILLQGGLNPDLRIEWYEDLFRH